MSELLPCPFCGGEAEMLTAESMNGGYLFGIMCNDCRSRGDVYDTEDEAIEAWNTRAQTVFGMTLDEVRQMMKRDAELEHNGWLCSACGYLIIVDSTADLDSKHISYCPNCGAFFEEYDELKGDTE